MSRAVKRKTKARAVKGVGSIGFVRRALVERNHVLYVCQPFPKDFKCGQCGRGNMALKIGFMCRVCKARLVIIERSN